MFKKLTILAVFLLFSTAAKAQSNPCDSPATTNPTVSSPAKIGICFDGKNSDGSPTVITVFKVYVGTSTTPLFSGLLQPIGTTASNGQNYYETPALTFPVGTNNVKATISSAAGEGPASPTFPFTVVVIKPGAPSIIQIVR